MRERSSRAAAVLGAAWRGLGGCRPEAAAIFVVALAAAALATLAPGAGATIPARTGLSAAAWRPALTVGLVLAAGLTALATAAGVGACLVRTQRPRLALLGALGLTPGQLVAVAGLQPILAALPGALLGAAAAALATGERGPAAIASASAGAGLCLLAVVLAAPLAARDAAPPEPYPHASGGPRRRPGLRTWGLPPALAIGMATRRDPSLRGLRRLLPLLLALDALLRELAAGGSPASPAGSGWQRSLLPPGPPGLVVNALLGLAVAGYLGTFLVRARGREVALGTMVAMGATRGQLLAAAAVPAVLAALAGLVLAVLAVALLHLPSSPSLDPATAVTRPSVLIPPAAALVAALVGAIPPTWRRASVPPPGVVGAA
ncbi:MAG TPA: FtsX-like permease family protein [Candidatus Dormibacteraeota bacterium]|nr:FtsX-like permease family protein [Candidatus Dormibacteraeota bacterium]